MASEIISELKLQHIQGAIPGLECDQSSDLSIFMGDMNYRMNTTFSRFNNSSVRYQALDLFPSLDQLQKAFASGNYPGYEEAKISFLPTYKLSKTEDRYIDKKDQAPSYCDRVLYKNNMAIKAKPLSYESLDECYGSDHRPVVLQLALRHFERVRYWEFAPLTRFSGTSEVSSEVGVIDFDYL